MLGHSSITMTYAVYGYLFHDPEKDGDLLGEMERGLLAAWVVSFFKKDFRQAT